MIKWIALYAPMRWPAGMPTVAEFDQQKGGTRPTDFAADVADLEAAARAGSAAATAPGRGIRSSARCRRPAWLRWAYLHMDHHLRQFGA